MNGLAGSGVADPVPVAVVPGLGHFPVCGFQFARARPVRGVVRQEIPLHAVGGEMRRGSRCRHGPERLNQRRLVDGVVQRSPDVHVVQWRRGHIEHEHRDRIERGHEHAIP